jgi:hypothetical protein
MDTIFPIILYGLHSLSELVVGITILLTGFYTYETSEERQHKPQRKIITARFHASGLIALGVLAILTVVGPGTQSETGKVVSVGLLVFHFLGTVSMFFPVSDEQSLSRTDLLKQGPFILHSLLTIGFMYQTLSSYGIFAGK